MSLTPVNHEVPNDIKRESQAGRARAHLLCAAIARYTLELIRREIACPAN